MSDDRHTDELVHDARERFGGHYGQAHSPALRELELRTLGAGWGGNGYTTAEQATWLGGKLGLKPDSTVLEVGAGAGWPGLWLAKEFGCRVVMTDIPLEGLVAGRDRAAGGDIESCSWVASAGARLPFASRTFDVVSHSDVLC